MRLLREPRCGAIDLRGFDREEHCCCHGFRGVNPISLTPPAGLRAIVALGAEESSEFHLQSEAFAERWASHTVQVTSIEVPGVAHFGVMKHLIDGVLLDAALELLDAAS